MVGFARAHPARLVGRRPEIPLYSALLTPSQRALVQVLRQACQVLVSSSSWCLGAPCLGPDRQEPLPPGIGLDVRTYAPGTRSDDLTQDEPNAVARRASAEGKHLVVVVHGVGDAAAGSTVGTLARAVAVESGRSLAPTREVLWLPEGEGRRVEVFPSHVERLRDEGGDTVFAEVTWEDLSRISPGPLGTIGGLIRLVFGVGAIARHAADPARPSGHRPDPWARALQKMSALVAYWLRGPVAALTALASLPGLILTAILLLAGNDPDFPLVADGWARWILLVVSLILLGVALLLRGRRRGKAFFRWLGLAGFAHAAVLALPMAFVDGLMDSVLSSFDLRTAGGFIAQIGPVFVKRGMLWVLTMTGSLLLLAVFVLVMAITWLLARVRSPLAYRPGLDAACAVSAFSTGVWLVASSTAAAPLVVNVAESIHATDEILRASLLSIGIHWAGTFLLLLATSWTLAARWRWTSEARRRGYSASRPAPRLLLGRPTRSLLILLAFVGPSLFLWQYLELLGLEPLGLVESLAEINVTAVQFTALVGAGAVYFIAHMSFGLDLGLDIVSYFRRETPRAGGQPGFLLRKQIQDRLRIVLQELVARERPDRVTVLAHSQGTVIAIDVLAGADSRALLAPLARCDLVTMGSPFRHLYQYYFPNDYPPLSDPRWNDLRDRVDRWVNVFRSDDFVGAEIEPGGDWPENCPVDPGGHTGYWDDRQVLAILRARQLV